MKVRTKVVLVDEKDVVIGEEEKAIVHKRGLLHRAVSVFIFNKYGKIMLQQRSLQKIYGGGLWSYACSAHPSPDENIRDAALRRLKEEMGIGDGLKQAFKFRYKVSFENRFIENEYNYVFIGYFNGEPRINLSEVENWKWSTVDDLREDIDANPDQYTYLIKLLLDRVLIYIGE